MSLPVQENSAEALVKVLAQSGDGLLQYIKRSRALNAVGALIDKVVIQDLVDWMRMRQGNQLLVLGDVLPIVNQKTLDVIWDRELD